LLLVDRRSGKFHNLADMMESFPHHNARLRRQSSLLRMPFSKRNETGAAAQSFGVVTQRSK
jgi:hypothetical protein